ncbi:MAG TPA: inositol monophosphatase [Chromatiales bacterium]|nr:inositol monophosphatase [Thiotrichales bacterium]HIP67654.1 inositol monophosphatase [Chromatiales bacterium]
MHPVLNIAVQAARAAGHVIIRHINRIDSLTISNKARNDFVSEVDRMAEAEIIEVIKKAYPEHSILAEESGLTQGNDFQWVIDPLDGTTNFLYGIPHYAVSIAMQANGRTEQAVVFDPFKDELFTASYGAGAWLNNKRIRVSDRRGMENALIGTGIPFRPEQDLETYIDTLRVIVPDTAGIRRAGSAALDLAYVAAGRLDGFWEFSLKPWDMAAGLLLVQESGGLVGDLHGEQNHWKTGHVLCGTPKVYTEMKKRLNSVLKQ